MARASPLVMPCARAVFEYIEIDYNRNRKHSANGHIGPLAYENKKGRWLWARSDPFTVTVFGNSKLVRGFLLIGFQPEFGWELWGKFPSRSIPQGRVGPAHIACSQTATPILPCNSLKSIE